MRTRVSVAGRGRGANRQGSRRRRSTNGFGQDQCVTGSLGEPVRRSPAACTPPAGERQTRSRPEMKRYAGEEVPTSTACPGRNTLKPCRV